MIGSQRSLKSTGEFDPASMVCHHQDACCARAYENVEVPVWQHCCLRSRQSIKCLKQRTKAAVTEAWPTKAIAAPPTSSPEALGMWALKVVTTWLRCTIITHNRHREAAEPEEAAYWSTDKQKEQTDKFDI
jgi:hypothetical protein